jgi:predicted AlkP superfamily pyrophosphatase or phosphodiesterase
MCLLIRWIIILVVLFQYQSVHMSAQPSRPTNILLIGWDGASRDHVEKLLQLNKLPNLQLLVSNGTFVPVEVAGTTDTKAGWSQILTGYNPEVTGVYSNSRYQPVPKGYSIFARMETFFGSTHIFTAAVIGKKGHVDNDPPQKIRISKRAEARQKKFKGGTLVEEKGEKYMSIPGKPYYYTQDEMDLFINGLKTNQRVASEAIRLLIQQREQRFFLFIHFAETDHQGHLFGEQSAEYDSAFVSNDRWTGTIMNALKELHLDGTTVIYVTADHGFDPGAKRHRDARHVFLATNDPVRLSAGRRVDVAPTILDRYGIPLSDIDPPFNGISLTHKE